MKTAAHLLLLATLVLGSVVSRGDENRHGISKDDFIKVDGLRLYDSKGALHYLTGTGIPDSPIDSTKQQQE
jgi:hypothetical protein